MRLLVHAGFHKTGTSSIQQTLAANRALLEREIRILLKPDIAGLAEAARAWSDGQRDVEWSMFVYEAAQVLAAIDPVDPRPVVISAEDLAGHMPGRLGLVDYAAAPLLMAGLIEVAREAAPSARFEFLFTTREAEPWVKSCHAQHVLAVRCTQDFEQYRAAALPHADLAAMARKIAAAVAPAPVHVSRLEDTADLPLGPLEALLDLARVSTVLRDRLESRPPANTALPPHILDRLLAMNRSDRPWSEIRHAKRHLARRARGEA